MANRRFVRVPAATNFVPNTRVKGSFERPTAIGLAMFKAGWAGPLPVAAEAALRLPKGN